MCVCVFIFWTGLFVFFCYQYFSALLLNWFLVKRKRTGKNTKVRCYKTSFSHVLLLRSAAEKCRAKTIFLFLPEEGNRYQGGERRHVLKMNTTSTFLFFFFFSNTLLLACVGQCVLAIFYFMIITAFKTHIANKYNRRQT